MCDGSGCGGRGPESALMTSVCGDILLTPPPLKKQEIKKCVANQEKVQQSSQKLGEKNEIS